jgi:predicted lipase
LNGTQLIIGFKSSATDQAGYIAISPSLQTIIVSFRGTASITGTIIDLDIRKSTPDFATLVHLGTAQDKLPSGAKIHAGFERSYDSVRSIVQSNLKETVLKFPSYQIVFVGHSLGGAIATLAALDFSLVNARAFDDRISIYTFAQPRVGNSEFATWFSKSSFSKRFYRVSQETDPVPQLPFLGLGFQHVGIPFQIKLNGDLIQCPISGPGLESSACFTPAARQNFQFHSGKNGYYKVGQLTCFRDQSVG